MRNLPAAGGRLFFLMMCVLTVFCRSKLVMFALVPKNNSQFEDQKNFFERFIVSPNITCDDPVQKNYYTMKNIPTICNVCWTDLSDNKEILDLIITKKKEYLSVTPSCLSVDCGDFICLRKKKIVHDPQRVQSRTRPSEDGKRRRTGEAEP